MNTVTYLRKQIDQHRTDLLTILILAIAIAIPTYLGTHQIPDPIFTDFYAQDTWFGSDIPTVFGNITSLNSDFGRNNKHPLFPLLIFPFVYALGTLLRLDPLSTIRIIAVFVSILWISSLYVLLRCMGCYRLDATLLSVLGGVSAASTFWLVTPETFSFGSVTILLGLVFVVLTQYRQFSFIWYVGVNVLTVSITITNAMVGIFATLVNQRWKRVIQIGIVSLSVAIGLWILQRIIFTNSGFPFQPGTFIGEKKFVSAPEHGGVLAAISSFFYQTMLMPATEFLASPARPDWIKLENSTLSPASGGWMGTVAFLSWTGLLILGLWGLFSIKQHSKLRLVLGLTLIAQLLMHSIYGVEETFIYSLHFAPLLLTLVAFGLFTRFRLLSLGLTLILIISAGVTNRVQFNQITTALHNYGTPHQQVEAQMKLRPTDPWTRDVGHVVLASPGSLLESKALHEPGGSFSPEPGSFGVSIWVVDRQGAVKATSDSIPLKEIQQQFVNASSKTTPSISTQTPYYQSSWSIVQPGHWQLNLNRIAKTELSPMVVIRSVGPAGGAIYSLKWENQRLLINDRWVIKILPQSVQEVYLGSERSPNWSRQKPTVTQWQDDKGWGYARLELKNAEICTIEIEDLTPEPASGLTVSNPISKPIFKLPDTQFSDSFNAQVAHLLMGLVGNQTRPVDPITYPLPRFRDGAYEVLALARTGHLEVAKQLVPYFAATDFINGTQAEAEIPALGIWVLTAVAEQANQPDYDQRLWADIRRKADLITDLLSTNRPGYPISGASRVPFSEHPDFVRTELIAGRMDALPGLIALDPSANLMSYRALSDAATFADRVKQPEIAARWRSQASQLQTAWQKAFDLRFAKMDATYRTALWPSWIATINQSTFREGLDNRWQTSHDAAGNLRWLPDNTNFDVAEAHQWLYLNQPDRVWSTLRWYWNHQASPGLYTWWGKTDDPKGTRIPRSLSHWDRYRGWVNPPHVTPHYWTAAEMLLLQLDMLAYVDQTTNTPTLVIGAGIPQEWTRQPLSIQGLSVGGTIVDWKWDGKQMIVQFRGKPMNLTLGGAFPATTPITILPKSNHTQSSFSLA